MKHIASAIIMIILSVVLAPSAPAIGQDAAVRDDFHSRIEEKIREYTQKLDDLTDRAAGRAAGRAKEFLAEAEQKLKELKPHAQAALKDMESSLRTLMERIEKELGRSPKENKSEWI